MGAGSLKICVASVSQCLMLAGLLGVGFTVVAGYGCGGCLSVMVVVDGAGVQPVSSWLGDGVWGLNKTGDSELARHVSSLWFSVAEEMAWLAKVLMVLPLLVR